MSEVDTGNDVDRSASEKSRNVRLIGSMGVPALVLTVLAFSAPMSVVEGFLPLAIGFGGPGAVFAVLITTIVLLLFASGYVTMARHVPKPGAFYAFISAGLGKITGLGAAFLAVFGYMCVIGGSFIFLGLNIENLIESMVGIHSSWVFWAVFGWAVVGVLGYFHIELSAKILSVAMVFEVLIVVIFNCFVLGKGGAEGLQISPFTPSAFSQGNMATTLLFAILVFMGFEATALFRDEVREPNKTIPRATYGAVLFIGVLYTFSTYSLVSAYGVDAWEVAKNRPTEMFAQAAGHFVAPVFTQIAYVSVVISIFAAVLAIHNVISRYVFSLAVDKVLPRSLAKIHKKHCSPYIASLVVSVVVGLAMIPGLGSIPGEVLYGVVTGIGAIAVIFLMGLVSCAVVAWFLINGTPKGVSKFKTFWAPGFSAIMLIGTTIFACVHLEVILGGEPSQNDWVIVMMAGVFMLGVIIATYFRCFKPSNYTALGSAVDVIDNAV
ncbi:APC family permease [Pseudomonas sp. Teo4]|uniref:APC family permease n=1 Tax=Pseudomonas sp. Teo4 TaxID=3064528 RepID=UPI002AB9962A|nr:APC family permease [Pseudomonas sp. Teo4]MDZ3992559.1 hypothetical protein [Pseudomonas sp. Teo4]